MPKNPLAFCEMPKHKNHRGLRWRDFFWPSPTKHRRLLWHFHCSSSILFCVLVSLNLLDGVVPFGERQNGTDEGKTEKNSTEMQKINVSRSNSDIKAFSMNEDDELTREILALFDYEDKWDKAQNRTIDTQRGDHSNGSNVNWAKATKLETEQLQFSMDPSAANSTNEWTTKSGEKTGEIQMEKGPAKEQQQLAEYDQLASNGPTKVETIVTKTTPEQAEMTMATENASETTAYSQRNHSIAKADLEREVNGTEMAQRKWEKVANDGERKGNSSEGEEKVPKMEENGHEKEMPTDETENKANRTEKVGSVLPVSPFSSAPTVPSLQIAMPSVGILEEALGIDTASPSTITYSENKLNKSTEPSFEFTNITMPLVGTEMAPSNFKSIKNENETEILAKNQSENAKSNLTTNTSQSTTELKILYPLESELSLPLLSPMPPTELPMINYEANGTDTFVEEMSNRTEEGKEANGTSAGEGIKGGALEELKRKVEGKMRIDDAEFVELSEYRQHLRQILSDVESVLSKWPGQLAHFSDFPKSRRFISISASMPNRNSDLFIARKNAISVSVSSNFEEIRKSPVKMGTTEAITVQMEKMPILTTTEKTKKEKIDREKETDGKETMGQKTKTIEEETNTEEIVGKKGGNTVEEKKETEEETTEKERMAKETKTGEKEARETMAKETKIGETVARETEARKTTETRETETRKTVAKEETETRKAMAKGIETRETETRKTMAKGTETSHPSDSLEPIAGPLSSESDSDERPHSNSPKKTGFFRAEHFSSKYFSLIPLRNISAVDHCKHLAQDDLVHELKQKGTYNPELMAWDVSGVFRFLDKTITDQYERQSKAPKSSDQAVKRNVEALERLLSELNLRCDVRSPEVLSLLGNLTMNESKRSIISPSLRQQKDQFQLMRHKRNSVLAHLVGKNDEKRRKRRATKKEDKTEQKGGRKQQRKQKQKMIGDVHAVPFGCDKRGDSEDGYLRLCGACQTIRKLPDEFFPPFINEVACDEDKACLYFYDYPHGKCKQKHMNFVVLKNVGTPLCQIWEKFNLNVRVSCECFVDEMSFFSKYV